MRKMSIFQMLKMKIPNVSGKGTIIGPTARFGKVFSLGLFLGVVNYYPSFKGEKFHTMSLFSDISQTDINSTKLEKKASNTVVIIYSAESNQPIGSGFLINDQGEFLTISNIFFNDEQNKEFEARRFYVRLLGDQTEKYSISLQYNCEEENICVLKIIPQTSEKFPRSKLQLSFAPSVEKAQSCYLFSKNKKDINTIATGLVCENAISNLESKLEGHFTSAFNLITNIPNSNVCAYGAPVFDIAGNIMGIVLPVDPHVLDSQSILMPAGHLEAILEQYKQKKEIKRPYIGISIKSGNSVKGAFVIKVNTGAPANQAGVRLGDTITAVNGFKINNADEFFKALGYRLGPIKLTLERDGKTRDVDLTSV